MLAGGTTSSIPGLSKPRSIQSAVISPRGSSAGFPVRFSIGMTTTRGSGPLARPDALYTRILATTSATTAAAATNLRRRIRGGTRGAVLRSDTDGARPTDANVNADPESSALGNDGW